MPTITIDTALFERLSAEAERSGQPLENYLTMLLEFSKTGSDNKLHMLTQITSDYIYSTVLYADGTFKTEWVAGAFEAITGYNVKEIESFPRGWASLVHPDDTAIITRTLEVRKTQDWDTIDYRIITARGEIRWLHDHYRVVRRDPVSRAIYGIGGVQDITASKNADAKLLAQKLQTEIVLRNVADPVLMSDVDGVILYVNSAWERTTGYSSDEAVGSSTHMIESGNTPTDVLADLWTTIRSGRTWIGLLHNRRKNGDVYLAESTIVPVKNDGNEVLNFVEVHRDVTEERRAAQMREAFIANAAHDLANPIAVLETSLYLLKRQPDQLERRLPTFEQQVKHLHSLVRDLLTVSRLDRRIMLPHYEPCDLNQIVLSIVEAEQVLAHENQIELTFMPDEMMPVFVSDDDHLRRVLVNLISNAIQYTRSGGWVQVQTDQDGDDAIILVRDNGIGIPPHDLPNIFERFFRSDNARTLVTDSTGLGLSIVKELVDLHHGAIHVESMVDSGTTMIVRLPLQPARMTGR